jgi:prepilin-type processing-associated H-X9-DG protein
VNPGPDTSKGPINAPPGSFIRNNAVPDTFVCKTFICPSDGNTTATDSGGLVWGLTDYLAVNAPNTDQRDPGNTNIQGVFYYWGHFTLTNGVYGGPVWGAATTIASITDGTSNTLMVGERPPVTQGNSGNTGGNNADFCGAWVYSEIDSGLGLPSTKIGWCASVDQAGNSCPSGRQYFQQPLGTQNPCDGNHYWSRHTGGGNWAFADGSVHFLSYGIGINIQAALSTKAGGEVIPGNTF